MNVRPATDADREDILRVHVAAIRELGPAAYARRQVQAWATKEGPETYPIDEPGRYVVVVEPDEAADEAADGGDANADATATDRETSGDGAGVDILGFGQLDVDESEISAVYVDPDHARRGVGSTLLSHLEAAAREHGIATIELLASLNAVPFYEAHGYEPVEPYAHETTGGVEMECLWMRKRITE